MIKKHPFFCNLILLPEVSLNQTKSLVSWVTAYESFQFQSKIILMVKFSNVCSLQSIDKLYQVYHILQFSLPNVLHFFRFPCPPMCPQAVYIRIIYPCWQNDPHERTSFSKLISETEDLLTQYWNVSVIVLYSVLYWEGIVLKTRLVINSNLFGGCADVIIKTDHSKIILNPNISKVTQSTKSFIQSLILTSLNIIYVYLKIITEIWIQYWN